VTLKIPKANFLDAILEIFGKKRGVIFPANIAELYKKYGPHAYIKAKRENFLKTLLTRNLK